MEQNSASINSAESLAKLLEQKKSGEKTQIEKLIQDEFQRHVQSLSDASKAALSTTMADIENQMKALSNRVSSDLNTPLSNEINSLKKRLEALSKGLNLIEAKAQAMSHPRLWLRPLLIGTSLFLGTFFGSWGLMHYLSSSVQTNLQMIKEQRQTLDQLQSGGISVKSTGSDLLLVLPEGKVLEPGWTVSGKPAVKLIKQ